MRIIVLPTGKSHLSRPTPLLQATLNFPAMARGGLFTKKSVNKYKIHIYEKVVDDQFESMKLLERVGDDVEPEPSLVGEYSLSDHATTNDLLQILCEITGVDFCFSSMMDEEQFEDGFFNLEAMLAWDLEPHQFEGEAFSQHVSTYMGNPIHPYETPVKFIIRTTTALNPKAASEAREKLFSDLRSGGKRTPVFTRRTRKLSPVEKMISSFVSMFTVDCCTGPRRGSVAH